MAFKQAMYSDFSGGHNDTAAAISISDKETALSENVDYSAEVKALKTRKGCTKANSISLGANNTDGHSWTIGSQYKKCIVKNSKVYEISNLGQVTEQIIEKISLTSGAMRIYPFVVYDKFYFGDGTELYVWGDTDYYSEEGTVTVAIGEVVKNNNSTSGTIGNFYKALTTRTSIDLKTENYLDTSNWVDVTDVRYKSSTIVRKVKAYDPSQKEAVLISITKGAAAAGTITINLNNTSYTFTVAAGDSVSAVVDKMYAMATSGWTKTKISNSVKFTKDVVGVSENGYFDPLSTGVTATYETTTEGKANNNDLAPIKKCTMFAVHPSSYRVFAAGNPDDNGLYYSEIGKPTYFVSAINKVYPANGYGKVTGLSPLSEAMLASYEDGWYAWNGITPLEDATWRALNLPYGCACHDSISLTPYSFTYLSREGIYTVSASILSSEVVLLQGRDIIKKITENKVDKAIQSISNKAICKGIFYDNVYYLAYNTDGYNNNMLLKYEWDTKSFTIATGWLVNKWLADPDNLYFATKNYVLKANDGYSDIDVETGEKKGINVKVISKEYPLGNPLSQKVAQFIGLLFKQNSAETSDVNITIHMGYESMVIGDDGTIDLAESLNWGRAWGKVWGHRESIIKMLEIGRMSNTFQIEITNSNLDDPITLIGIGFIYEETDLVLPNILKDEVLLK